MDETPKKRPWFQFHLSTAVVLMFVAAGLLWLNMRDTWSPWVILHGWPFVATERMVHFDNDFPFALHVKPLGLAANALFALVVLYLVAFLCEWRIRRKSARAEPPEDGPINAGRHP